MLLTGAAKLTYYVNIVYASFFCFVFQLISLLFADVFKMHVLLSMFCPLCIVSLSSAMATLPPLAPNRLS